MFKELFSDKDYYIVKSHKIDEMISMNMIKLPNYSLTEQESKNCYDAIDWAMDLTEPEAASVLYILCDKYPLLALCGLAERMKCYD